MNNIVKKGNIPWNKGIRGSYCLLAETRQKISLSLKGKNVSVVTRAKLSASKKGHLVSEETRRKISISKKGGVPWISGKKHSIETRKKLSDSHKGQVPWNKGKRTIKPKLPPKVNNRFKGHTHTIENRQAHSRRMLGYRHTEEAIQKIKEAQRKRPLGSKNPQWKGGRQLALIKDRNKRRGYGSVFLNDHECGFVGHHIDRDHIMYIPEEIHLSYWHAQRDKESMDKINEVVINWYAKYYGLIQ